MNKTKFINCNMFDGYPTGGIKKCSILVNNDKIVKICDDNTAENGYKIIDLKGKYVVPGLINPHVHLFGTGLPSKVISGGKSQEMVMKLVYSKLGDIILGILVKSAALQQLNSGVTTVRSVGDMKYSDVILRNKINDGKFIGPRLIVSGPAITVPGGHGAGTMSITAEKPEDLKALVRQNNDRGVNFIKICVTGGVIDAKVKGEPGEVRMSLEQTKAVCDEAHKLGLKVASHTESVKGVKITAAAGVDSVEHGAALDDEIIKQMKASGSAMVVTYSPALPLTKIDPSISKLNPICVYNTEIVVNNMTAGAKDCLNNGILVGMGTDSSCPFSTQYNMWREVVFFKNNIGVSNAEALSVATLNNAKIIGVDKITGTIETGKSADFIVTEKNPLEDLSVLRNLDMVVVRGHIINDPHPKRMKSIEQQLDNMPLTM